jgi:hypothetical protein
MIWRNRQTTAISIIVACLALVPLGAAAEEIPEQTDTLSLEATVAPWAAVDLEGDISLDEEGGQLVGQTGMVVEANFTYNLAAGWSASSPWKHVHAHRSRHRARGARAAGRHPEPGYPGR